jgi:hypothetical protein
VSIKPGKEKAKKGTLVQFCQTTVYIINPIGKLFTRFFPIPFEYLNKETHKNNQPQYLVGGIF